MRDKTIYNLHANICKALANPIRIEIIDILGDNEMTFGEIQEITSVLKSNLSQHLSLMVANGILSQRKEGLNMYFKLSTEKISIACRMMREVLIENLKKHHELIKDY
jgi:ArsR family transcriptional regulator